MIEEAPPPSDTAHDAEKDSVKFTFDEELPPTPCIKVVGVGGGGGNAVNRMIEADIPGMEFAAVNTDVQALRVSRSPTKLQLGAQLTQGYGAGSDHKIGRNAALEDTERLIELLSGADMVFVTAGLGGGTGTGAAPVVASLAKEMGALTIAVVTKPFAFEGARRMEVAEQGLAELAETVDTVITIPNEYLLAHVENGTSFFEAFRIADDILLQAVRGISDIVTIPGIVNCDFADIRTVMLGMGYAVVGTATHSGENAAIEAARAAIAGPLLENADIGGARGILINITGSSRLGLHEVHGASTIIQQAANENANIIFGVAENDSMGENVKVTVIATGFRNLKEDLDESPGNAAEPEQNIRAAADAFSIAEPAAGDPAPEPERTDAPQFPVSEKFDSPDGESETAPAEEDIDRPAFFRRHFSGAESAAGDPAPEPERTDAPQLPVSEKFDSPGGESETAPARDEDIGRPAFFRRRFK